MEQPTYTLKELWSLCRSGDAEPPAELVALYPVASEKREKREKERDRKDRKKKDREERRERQERRERRERGAGRGLAGVGRRAPAAQAVHRSAHLSPERG